MKVLGVITARGGSKRLPNKNTAMLGGKPLIAWSIEVGQKTCNNLVLSTDSEFIAGVAQQHNCEVIMRPPELSGDANHVGVVVHAAVVAAKVHGEFNAVMLLQPTSPFRTVEDCEMAKQIMVQNGADSVISVIEFPRRDTLFTIGHADRLRDANQPSAVFTPNGAIYLIKWNHLLSKDSWYYPHAYAYVMPPERSIDIDTHADFEAAKAMLDDQGQFDPGAIAKKASALA
jgi:CMP-N,N'-diacetyllegionaminic acid synthase